MDVASLTAETAKLLAAYGLALPIAWNRERGARSAGLRTFPIVAIASCGFALLGQQALAGAEAQSRVVQGLLTGIGFVGGGAILKRRDSGSIHGTATAASLWNTAAIGACVAYSLYGIAVLLALVNLLTLVALTPLKRHDTDDPADGRP